MKMGYLDETTGQKVLKIKTRGINSVDQADLITVIQGFRLIAIYK